MLQVSISQVCYAIELPAGCSYMVRLTKWELLNNHQNRLKHNNQVSWILQVWRCGGVEVWRCGGVEVWRCGSVEV